MQQTVRKKVFIQTL